MRPARDGPRAGGCNRLRCVADRDAAVSNASVRLKSTSSSRAEHRSFRGFDARFVRARTSSQHGFDYDFSRSVAVDRAEPRSFEECCSKVRRCIESMSNDLVSRPMLEPPGRCSLRPASSTSPCQTALVAQRLARSTCRRGEQQRSMPKQIRSRAITRRSYTGWQTEGAFDGCCFDDRPAETRWALTATAPGSAITGGSPSDALADGFRANIVAASAGRRGLDGLSVYVGRRPGRSATILTNRSAVRRGPF